MQFTEFKTSAIILGASAVGVTAGVIFMVDGPSEAFWALTGLTVGGLLGIAKDLVTSGPGDSESYRLAEKLIDKMGCGK